MTPGHKTGIIFLLLIFSGLASAYLLTDHSRSNPLEYQTAEYRAIMMERDDYYHPPINLAPKPTVPVGPDKSRFVTDPHGWRKSPTTGEWQDHKGVDISGGYRCEIYAALPGWVYDTGYNGTDGFYVTLIHADGWRTKYCHLSSVYARERTRVPAGQVIGRMGHTGASTGEHLHFELWHMGSDCNPLDYLPITCDGEGRF